MGDGSCKRHCFVRSMPAQACLTDESLIFDLLEPVPHGGDVLPVLLELRSTATSHDDASERGEAVVREGNGSTMEEDALAGRAAGGCRRPNRPQPDSRERNDRTRMPAQEEAGRRGREMNGGVIQHPLCVSSPPPLSSSLCLCVSCACSCVKLCSGETGLRSNCQPRADR